ncbi:hypothetical protein Tco_0506574, partial [Tanacetum coccineum]
MTYPCHWFSEQVGLAGDLGSTNDVLIPLEMDDPNITMEEYIQLMADKAHKHGQMFDWETHTYGKIYDDIDLFKDFEADFLPIVYNYALASDLKVSSEPTLISVNDLKSDTGNDIDEINVKLPSEDISIKPLDSVIIEINLDTLAHKHGQMFDWETDTYGKIYDDIDLFKYFEADFPAIVYNYALASDLKVSSDPL